MDKYEYRLKAGQIEKLVKKQDYVTAAKIADTIDWRRVHNLNMLYMVSDIYEKTERYEDCLEILNIAYDRAPVGRLLLYRMTDMAAKLHNFEEAIALYREFVRLAPHDQSRYILKYEIYRERGSSVEDQIKILNEYKSHEYQERWAYELALRYAEAGQEEECVRECDELILWFSDGEYVNKALELKKKYAPLTAAQQEKYDRMMSQEESLAHEDDFDETEVPEFSSDKFSTMNLQAELAANLGEILMEDKTIRMPTLDLDALLGEEEPEKETAEEPAPEEAVEFEELVLPEEEPEKEAAPEETIEFEELTIPEEEPEEESASEETVEFEELMIPEEEPEEETASEEAVEFEDLELPEEEPAEEPAPEETVEFEDLMLPEEEPAKEAAPEEAAALEDLKLPEEEPAAEAAPEKAVRSERPAPSEAETLEEIPQPEKQITGQMTIDDILAEWKERQEQAKAALEAGEPEATARRERVKQETIELFNVLNGSVVPEDVQRILAEEQQRQDIEKEKKEQKTPDEEAPVVTEDDLPPDLDEPDEEAITFEDLDMPEEMQDSRAKQSGSTVSANTIHDLERQLAAEVSDMAVNAGYLTREQSRLFAYFTSVKGMSKQLSVLFKGAPRTQKSSSSSGNLVVTGRQGNGKTTLAIDIVKALQKQKRIGGKMLAKISGEKLNTKDIYDVLKKLKGGALIIESAGGMSDETMLALSLAMEGDTGGLLIILEDSAEEISRLFQRNHNFASKFDHTIDIPAFTNDELVAFGKSYAMEQEYVFDEFGILALYDRIGSLQAKTVNHLVTVAEVKEIIDEAIAHAEKGSVRHLFERMTHKNEDEFGNHLLREEDFR